MNPVILISVITALAFVAMAVYLATKGLKIQYPDGRQYDIVAGTTKVKVVIETRMWNDSAYARVVSIALLAVQDMWVPFQGSPFPYRSLVIHFTPKVWHNLHGLQTYAKSKIGNRSIPMLVIEDLALERLDGGLLREGGLVVHEATHLFSVQKFGHPDQAHDEGLWAEQSVNSFEGAALGAYRARMAERSQRG